MLKKIVTVLFILSSLWVQSQQIIKGKVIDKQTKIPLNGASVIIKNTTIGVQTNASGEFKIETKENYEKVVISYIGYEEKEVLITNLNGIIELTVKEELLETVVVSASRTRQKREDVPVAISTVTSGKMAEMKPNTADEVLNQISGVLMVPLGGEQHMMAIRQPISTKSVFLYLEDGVAIRPTGVFNHNALLEMNLAATKNIEIIRGPYSSLYGSEAIGGAINFITENPSENKKATISVRANNLGYSRLDFKYSDIIGKTGILLAAYKAKTKDGYRDYGDNDKNALTAKITHQFSDKMFWTNTLSYVSYFSEMSGSIGEDKFLKKDYASDHTFTYRDAKVFRLNSTLKYRWNDSQNSSLTFLNRYNRMEQNPSYRISSRTAPDTYTKGQINDNKFTSFGLIAQHNLTFDKAKINAGFSLDYSPNSYVSDEINVYRNTKGIFESYTLNNKKLSHYDVDLFNIGVYASGEYSLSEQFKLNAGIRLDQFNYDFTNLIGNNATDYKAPDSKNSFTALTPRIGLIYKASKNNGVYLNYSNGFIPPSVGELYRRNDVPLLDPATFNNYEIGNWLRLFQNKVYIELGAYYMKGKNEVVSVTTIVNGDETRENKNVGETEHYGLEYLFKYKPFSTINFRLSGSYSKHKYIDFVTKINEGVKTDFSGNEMPGAPNWVSNAEIVYKPSFVKNLSLAVEWQHVGKYFTDEKNTIPYNGYDIYNARIGYKLKKVYAWLRVNNLTDKLYSPRVATRYGKTTYTPGPPITYNFGIEYNIF